MCDSTSATLDEPMPLGRRVAVSIPLVLSAAASLVIPIALVFGRVFVKHADEYGWTRRRSLVSAMGL